MPTDCFPQHFDASDVPFSYYHGTKENSRFMKDYGEFVEDIIENKLPSVSFVKGLGFRTAHPTAGLLSDAQLFLQDIYE